MPSAENFAFPLFKWLGENRFVKSNDGRDLIFVPGGIGLCVKNYDYDKKVILRFTIYRQDGCLEQYILYPSFKKHTDGGDEEWSTNQLPLFPWHNIHGEIVYSSFSYIIQSKEKAVYPEYEFLFATNEDFACGHIKSGFEITGHSDYMPFQFDTHILERAAWSAYQKPLYTSVKFTREPLESSHHPLQEIHRLLDNVQDYVHLSMFNFDNRNICNHLIHLAYNGVNIECIGGWEQTSSLDWQETVGDLRRAGIPVYGVVRNTPFDHSGGIASMHTKFIVFDGKAVMSSSYNLDFEKWRENRENGIFYYSEEISTLYENLFQIIKGAPIKPYIIEPYAHYNIYYSLGTYLTPRGESLKGCDIIAHEILKAQNSILIAMFELSDFTLNCGISLYQALIDAKSRGLHVQIILNGFKCEIQGNHPWQQGYRPPKEELNQLLENGITVNLVYNQHNHYSPLHHKFVIIDGETTIAESANWYPATLYSDEVFSVIRNRETAEIYMEELLLILKYYRVRTF